MSIAIIRGPETRDSEHSEHPVISKVVFAQLLENAAMADKTLSVRTCFSEHELVAALNHANQDQSEFVIFDPGACDCSKLLDTTLNCLTVPYIEVHDDCYGTLEPTLAEAFCGRPLTVIHGYRSQSYVLALSIALEHLGCAECENPYHVGI